MNGFSGAKAPTRIADLLIMGNASRSNALRRRIDWIAVWIITVVASGFAVLSLGLSLVGDRPEWWAVGTSLFIAAIGGSMLARGRPNFVVALAIAVPIEVVRFRSNFPDLDYSVLAVQFAAFGLLAATMRPDRWVRMSMVTVASVMAVFITDVRLGGDDPVVLFYAAATCAGIVFVAWVLHVTTQAAQLREDDLQNLIDGAPVPTVVVDYTATKARLLPLRPMSSRALRAHLMANPRLIKDALELRRGVRANEEWKSFYGRTTADLEDLDRVIATGTPTPLFATLVEQCAAMVEDVSLVRREHEVADIGGNSRWIRSTWKVPVTDGALDHSHVLVSDVDVTTLKEAEAVLAEQIDSKDRFLASISHELRTPITAVAGFAQELAGNLETFEVAEARELLSVVAREASDVADIVDDLLVAARPDDAELTVVSEAVDIAGLIEWVAKGLPVDWQAPRDVKAAADTGRVRQILRNLVTNAVRHGGLDVRVAVGATPSVVLVEVSDDGRGIPPDLSDSLWDAYARGANDPGLTDSFGLGLYISRRLAVQMDGDLAYARVDGRTVFRLTLPRLTDANQIVTPG